MPRDSNYTRESETNNTVKLRVAKETGMKVTSRKQTRVVGKVRALIYFEWDKQLAQREQLLFVKRILKVLPNWPSYTLIVYATKAKLYRRKE